MNNMRKYFLSIPICTFEIEFLTIIIQKIFAKK